MGHVNNRKAIYGFGINDANNPVQPVVNGKHVVCPFYSKWTDMLRRCYSKSYHKNHPTYANCTVHPDWHLFSNFKAWMEQQEWQGKHLDKDLLAPGNRLYGPDVCIFIENSLNTFLVSQKKSIRDTLVGVRWHKKARKYTATCSNPFTKKNEHLGLFTCQLKAQEAWRKRKHELACQLADMQKDHRVAKALRVWFINWKGLAI